MNKKYLYLIGIAGLVAAVALVAIALSRNAQLAQQSPDATTNYSSNTSPQTRQSYSAPNDSTPPVITSTAPASDTTLQSNTTITLSADAADNIAVAKVEFLINGIRVCTKTQVPYTCSWTVPNQPGAHYLVTTRASDQTGNLASKSVVVSVR